jgi:hypothetical protein
VRIWKAEDKRGKLTGINEIGKKYDHFIMFILGSRDFDKRRK